MTSSCSFNRSITFVKLSEWGHIAEFIYFGDHGPSASTGYAHGGRRYYIYHLALLLL